jgi:hypothetical protein
LLSRAVLCGAPTVITRASCKTRWRNKVRENCLEEGVGLRYDIVAKRKSIPSQPLMQLTPREALLQFAHVLQLELFPCLEAAVGPLTPPLELLASVVSLVPLHRLRVDEALRQFCGWRSAAAVPHESKFSRAFAEFAAGQLPQHLHAALIEATQRPRLIGHIARDSTAIPARERFRETARQARRAAKKSKSKRPQGSFAKAKASERGTRVQQQRHQKLAAMLAGLPQQCDIGVKKNSQGHEQFWRGYKLHLDVADGQLPVSAVLTSASLHDSQVAIPLMTMTSQRVDYLYELMDSAYDAGHIHQHSRQLQHVPIIAPHPRRGDRKSVV